MNKSITQLLEDILTAVYGEDVRKSIHDSIKKCYEDATTDGNANMEVSQARGKYSSLGERLAADLSSTIKRIDEGDSRLRILIDSVASGSPLVASSVSEMIDTNRIYVNTSDGHWYWYDNSDWQDGGVYQAASIENELDLRLGQNHYSDYVTIDLDGVRRTGNMKRNSSVGDTIDFNSQNYYSNFEIPCNYLERYRLKFRMIEEEFYPYVALTDENDTILELYSYSGADGEFKEVELSVPYNAKKLYFWSYSNEYNISKNASCSKSVMISALEEINNIRKEMETTDSILPEYYYANNWLENKLETIKEKTAILNGIAFGFITDLHFKSNSLNSKYLLKEVFEKTSINFTICGGDYPSNYGNIEDVKNSGKTLLEYMRYNSNKILPIHGNHDFGADDNGNNVVLPQNYGYNYIMRPIEEQIKSEEGKLYWYKDIENQKIRIICLDGWENYPPKEDSSYNMTVGAWISQEQYEWFIDLLKNSNDYSVIVLTHSPLNSGMRSFVGTHQPIHDLLRAFKERTTYSYSRTGILYDGEVHSISFNADFTDSTGDLVCVINGHAHLDESSVVDGILDITTTCDAHYSNDGHGAVVGTITEQAFDIFCIDTSARTIETVRIGRGNDRHWNY